MENNLLVRASNNDKEYDTKFLKTRETEFSFNVNSEDLKWLGKGKNGKNVKESCKTNHWVNRHNRKRLIADGIGNFILI